MHISWRIADSLLPKEMRVCGCVKACLIHMYVHVKGNTINWRVATAVEPENTHVIVSLNCRLTELPPFQAKPDQENISFAYLCTVCAPLN